MLSYAASAIYLVTALLTLAAGLRVAPLSVSGNRPGERMQWIGIAVIFVLLAMSRISGAEEWLEGVLRTWLVGSHLYEGRRDIQRPVAAMALVVIALAALAFVMRKSVVMRLIETPIAWARTAAIAMLALVVVRVISFHPFDAVLYAKPLHPNWILDLGLTGIVAAAAVMALRRPFRAPPQNGIRTRNGRSSRQR